MVGFGFKATTSKPLASRAAPSKPKPSLFANDSDDEGDISNGAKGEDIGEFGEIDMPRSKTKKSLAKINPIKAPSAPPKHKPVRMADNSDDENENEKDKASDGEAILEFGGINVPVQTTDTDLRTTKKSSSNPLTEPPSRGPKSKAGANSYGDLSSALTSKKNAETAEALDANIYDYDAVYDSMKPKKHVTVEDEDRKPKYMKSLLEAAALRKRDQIIAEERKLQREREAEGDEYKDKEMFVTGAYKKQQEEARNAEQEEKEREEREALESKSKGFSGFYKDVLDREEKRHREMVEAAERAAKEGPKEGGDGEVDETEEERDARIAREINEKAGREVIELNDEGQVVDKRQMLKGGLNILPQAKKAMDARKAAPAPALRPVDNFMGPGGSKQAMRERQTKMMEAQLEVATKRAREDEEEEARKVERESKSRKTEGEIMSAKERYLQRKKKAEEAKKNGTAGD